MNTNYRTLFFILLSVLFCFSVLFADQGQADRDDVAFTNEPAKIVLSPEKQPRPYNIEALLWDNGPLVNSPGTGAGGADESVLQSVTLGMNTLGFGHHSTSTYMADDFTITDIGGWTIDSLIFFAYQTNAGIPSTFTGVYYEIWDGRPDDPASSVVFGDLTTNRLIYTEFSNIYRYRI